MLNRVLRSFENVTASIMALYIYIYTIYIYIHIVVYVCIIVTHKKILTKAVVNDISVILGCCLSYVHTRLILMLYYQYPMSVQRLSWDS